MPERRGDSCSTCRKAPACVKRSAAEKHGFECQEFSRQRGSPSEVRRERSQPHGEVQSIREMFMGLCSDCKNRESCCLAQTVEGGVWHCEEYC